MQTLVTIWNWLDGKKTVIGSAMLFAAGTIANCESTFAFHTPFLDQAILFLNDWGAKIAAFGAAMKFVKFAGNGAGGQVPTSGTPTP